MSMMTPKIVFGMIVAAILALTAGLPPSAATASGGYNQPQTHTVEITKFKFGPKSLSVKPGDTVTWINRDIAPHTATANDKSWSSPQLKRGESWSLKITKETFNGYFCKYHPAMKARLKDAD